MNYIYYAPTCTSCRKTIKWFDERKIQYKKINIINEKLSKEDVFRMLKYSENGFDDILSKKSKPYQEANIDFDELKTSDAIEFIINNPTVLKRPIIVGESLLEIGYNEEDITAFLPREMRRGKAPICDTCEDDKDNCKYEDDVALLIKEMKEAFKK